MALSRSDRMRLSESLPTAYGVEVISAVWGKTPIGVRPVATGPRNRQLAAHDRGQLGAVVGHSVARSFSGSHQVRLSRYHCTVSARPCAKVLRGS